jgi:hypothetical protein
MSGSSTRPNIERQSQRRLRRGLQLALVGAIPLLLLGAQAGPRTPAAQSVPAAGTPRPSAPILFQPVQTPAALAGLGPELARALCQAAKEADIAAQPGPGGPPHGPSRPDADNTVVGKLEELVQSRVRLSLTFRGVTANSVGDLEHLDDLVYAVFAQLRPRLALLQGKDPSSEPTLPAPGTSEPVVLPASSPSPGPGSQPGVALASVRGPAATSLSPTGPTRPGGGSRTSPSSSSKVVPSAASNKDPGKGPARPSGEIALATLPRPIGPPGPDKIGDKSADKASDKTPANPPDKSPDKPGDRRNVPDGGASSSVAPGTTTTTTTTLPTPTPTPPGPIPQPETRPVQRPRLVVGIVGEPVGGVPPGFYGMGAVGQQTVLSYMANRLRVPAVPGRMVGLVGGLEALGQSLRQGARHTFMVRIDSLSVGPAHGTGPFGFSGGATLSGRVHIVLLLDGRPLLDRSFMLPPTQFPTTEPPASVYSRALAAALDVVSPELTARLASAP